MFIHILTALELHHIIGLALAGCLIGVLTILVRSRQAGEPLLCFITLHRWEYEYTQHSQTDVVYERCSRCQVQESRQVNIT